jgi:hypothetical protein
MIELSKVERENKVYVNDKAIIVDRDTITISELLEIAGFFISRLWLLFSNK